MRTMTTYRCVGMRACDGLQLERLQDIEMAIEIFVYRVVGGGKP